MMAWKLTKIWVVTSGPPVVTLEFQKMRGKAEPRDDDTPTVSRTVANGSEKRWMRKQPVNSSKASIQWPPMARCLSTQPSTELFYDKMQPLMLIPFGFNLA